VAPFEDPKSLEAKLEIIKRGAGRLSVRVVHENPREAGLQALLAAGTGASPTSSSGGARGRRLAAGAARVGR